MTFPEVPPLDQRVRHTWHEGRMRWRAPTPRGGAAVCAAAPAAPGVPCAVPCMTPGQRHFLHIDDLSGAEVRAPFHPHST